LIIQDKLKKASPHASFEEVINLNKMAFNLLFMSQGIPFFHAGNEFLRDKKGHHNTYNAPFSINAIDWKNKARFYEVFKYVKDLIKLRKSYACFRLKTAEAIKSKIHFIEDDEYVETFKDGIVYIIKQDPDDDFECMLIAHNPSHDQMLLSVSQLKETILTIYANGSHKESHHKPQKHHKSSLEAHTTKPSHIKYEGVKKLVLPNENILIERIFDERGLLESPESVDPNSFHLVSVKPMSSAVFKLGRIDRK
jgi:pullulanase/glycogen debranching enzyme